MPVKIFFCYAHEDEALLKKLKTQLRPFQRQGLIDVWHDRDISAGTEWEQEITEHLNNAQIILLLVSPDFMESDYCYGIEMKRALERHKKGEARVIPVILRPVHWQDILGNIQALPTDGNPVTSSSWHSPDDAFFNVAEGIRTVIEEISKQSTVQILQPSLRAKDTQSKSKQSSKVAQHLKTNQPLQHQSPFQPTQAERNGEQVLPRNSSQLQFVEVGQPTLEQPALLCFALDVSDTMIDSVIDHAGKTVQQLATVKTVLDRFIYLGAAFVQDPETRRVLPLYHTIAYGFGFTERAHLLGISKKPGGAVRDLLANSFLPALPSVAQLTDHWDEYKAHFTSKKYTLDVLGSTPLCQALATIRDRIKAELTKKSFVLPVLLLIISDGIPTDGDPLPLISELHKMGVLTLCCYLGEQDILNAKQFYKLEDSRWSDGAKCMFHMASVLQRDSYITRAMFDYLENTGWNPIEGVRLFAQVNHSEALDNFLKILLSGFLQERHV